jgi:uncharacterized coiled-coil protein SlyX
MMRVWIVAVFVGLLVPGLALAQAPPLDPIGELLIEVRALRIAMERAATVGARIQLLVARMQLQEQRIAELSRRSTAIRDDITRADEGMASMAGEIKRLESYLDRGLPAEERPQVERQVEVLKAQLAITEKRRQDLVNEEALLSQQLTADQGRWADVNNQLDELERSLTPVKK